MGKLYSRVSYHTQLNMNESANDCFVISAQEQIHCFRQKYLYNKKC